MHDEELERDTFVEDLRIENRSPTTDLVVFDLVGEGSVKDCWATAHVLCLRRRRGDRKMWHREVLTNNAKTRRCSLNGQGDIFLTEAKGDSGSVKM